MSAAATTPWITPSWPAPKHVRACSTTRAAGVSSGPYEGLNLGDAVGDEAAAVTENRRILSTTLALKQPPLWLSQQHSNRVLPASEHRPGIAADGCISQHPGEACVVLGADCLPVLLCDLAGTRVAAVHAGWRGLAAGVIEAAVEDLSAEPSTLLAWLGPAISARAYVVGDEVRETFLARDAASESAFSPTDRGGWHADLYQLARLCLQRAGVNRTYGGNHCTYSEPEHFYSFRRDGICGRMASLIWISHQHH